MAKKRIHSVPFHEARVDVAGDDIKITLVKKVKGGKLALTSVVIDRKDVDTGKQALVDAHALLVDAVSS